MGNEHIVLGQWGERTALSFLTSAQYTILETNFRAPRAEIDIIARQSDTICFIEVKTRKSIRKGRACESVTPEKQKKIILGATLYLQKKRLMDSKVRFDVIEVYQKENQPEINHIKHAFQAG